MKGDVAQRLSSGRETKKNENDSLCTGYTLSGFDGGKNGGSKHNGSQCSARYAGSS